MQPRDTSAGSSGVVSCKEMVQNCTLSFFLMVYKFMVACLWAIKAKSNSKLFDLAMDEDNSATSNPIELELVLKVIKMLQSYFDRKKDGLNVIA